MFRKKKHWTITKCSDDSLSQILEQLLLFLPRASCACSTNSPSTSSSSSSSSSSLPSSDSPVPPLCPLVIIWSCSNSSPWVGYRLYSHSRLILRFLHLCGCLIAGKWPHVYVIKFMFEIWCKTKAWIWLHRLSSEWSRHEVISVFII